MKIGNYNSKTGDFICSFEPASLCSFIATGAALAASAASTAAAGAATAAAAGAVTAGAVTAGVTAGVGAAAGAGFVTAATAGTGFFASLTTAQLLQGAFTAFSAISAIAKGKAQKDAAETSARFEEFGSKQEILKGRKEALSILEAENVALEQNIVNAAASGITSSGSVQAAQQAVISKAEFETGITRSTASINAATRTARAKELRVEGRAAQTAGITSAVGSVGEFGISVARRK